MSYQIKIAGILDQSWADWLGEAKMITEHLPDGTRITTLTIDTGDPARLFGILDHLRDLNLTLISVTPYDNESDHNN